MKIRKLLHYVALLGRPVLRLLGVKPKTVASKAADVVEAVDKALPKD